MVSIKGHSLEMDLFVNFVKFVNMLKETSRDPKQIY